MKKIFLIFFFLISGVFAFNLNNAINELKCKEFALSNEKMVGMYKYFDPANKLWFLYMPNEKYLLIHETGKNQVSQGAKVINVKDFSNLTVNNGCVIFGKYNGNNNWAKKLDNKKFCLSNEKMVGMYKYFDPANKLWFLYMPNEKYLLIHETGKYTIKDGAKQVKITDYFKKIELEKDPFGNYLGVIKFISLNGCEETNTSSNIVPPSPETNISESSSSESNFLPPQVPSIK